MESGNWLTPTYCSYVPTSSPGDEGPGFWQLDVALVKSFMIRERWRIDLFINATNLLNHPNLTDPAMEVSVPGSVGQITGIRSVQSAEANDPGIGMRVLTRGLRVQF